MNSPFTHQSPTAASTAAVSPATTSKTLAREIQIDRVRAAGWLNYLEHLPSTSGQQDLLAQFQQHLSDACWLARWKRENVVFELDVTLIPGLVSELLVEASRSGDSYDQTVIEDIVATVTQANSLG